MKNSAFHDHYNRCVTAVHGTNFVHVENNVTYNTVGHCFFLEDGIEHGNEFVRTTSRSRPKCHTSKPCVPDQSGCIRRDSRARRIARLPDRTASNPRMCCCPLTIRWRVDPDHQSGQHLPRQRGGGFR